RLLRTDDASTKTRQEEARTAGHCHDAGDAQGHLQNIAHPGIIHRGWGYTPDMAHTIRKKKNLTHRVARIRGQVQALARALDGEAECGEVVGLIASARGAMDSLMAEVIEGHIRDHVFRGARGTSEERQAAVDLVKVVRSYFK